MLKKIRRFYWSMRDQGKDKQLIMFVFVFILSVGSIVGLGIRNVIKENEIVSNEPEEQKVATSSSVTVTSSAIDIEEEGLGKVQVTEELTKVVDVSGLDSFLAFMTDEAFEKMKSQLVEIAKKKNITSMKKLNYQQIKDGSFKVMSFVLMSDGSVTQVDYDLKSSVVSIAETTYSEADINHMNELEQKAEQEQIKKQQEADRKAKEKAKKKKKTKTKKKTKSKKKHKKSKSPKKKKRK